MSMKTRNKKDGFGISNATKIARNKIITDDSGLDQELLSRFTKRSKNGY